MGDYIVTGPDGKKYKMTADSPEAVEHAARQMFAAPAAPAAAPAAPTAPSAPVTPTAPPAEPSLTDRIMSTGNEIATQGAIGLRKGVATIAGLPYDLAALVQNLGTAGINKVLGTEIPYNTRSGAGTIDQGLAAPARAAQAVIGAPQQDPEPEGMTGRVARRVGEEIGATSVPVVGAIAKGTRVGVEGARELGPLQRMFVEPAAVNPTKFARRELGMATAAGTGAGTANELTGKGAAEARGEKPSIGQQLGDIGGAVTGAAGASIGSTLARAGGHVVNALRGKQTMANEVARDVAVDEIARAAGLTPDARLGKINTQPLADKIMGREPVGDTIPGYVESTADATKNPGLAAMEYSRQSGPNSGAYTAQRTANVGAVDAAVNRSAPDPAATPGAFSSELELERTRRLTDAGTATAQAGADAEAATRGLQAQGTPAARGNTIRGELDTARTTARDETRQAYEAAGIENNPLAPTTLAEALDSTTAALPYADRINAPQGLIEQIANIPAGTPITVREASALKTNLLGLIDQAEAQGNRNGARVLGQYVDAIEGVIQGAITPEQRAALVQARGARRSEGDAFDRPGDPVREALATRPGGVPRMRDENVAAATNRDSTVARYLEEADTPANREAIRNQLLSNADTSTAAGIDRFTQQYAQQLQRFPGLADELRAARGARAGAETAQAAETDLTRRIGPEGREPVAKYLRFGDERAESAMRSVLADKQPAKAIDDLLTFVNDDPKAVDGARKVFWDILQKDTRSAGNTTKTLDGKQPFIAQRLKDFLDDPVKGAVAARLYRDNPEHLDNLRKVADALQGVDTRNAAKAPNSSGTAQGVNQSYLPTGETIASRVFAVERGVVSPAFAALNIAGIIARKAVRQNQAATIDKLIDKALLEPDFAALLLKDNNPANRAAMRKATNGWRLHEGSTVVDMLDPGSQEDDTKRAVMK